MWEPQIWEGMFFKNFYLHALSVTDTRIESKYSELLVTDQRFRSYVDLQKKIKRDLNAMPWNCLGLPEILSRIPRYSQVYS
jgi:hypothetical protein